MESSRDRTVYTCPANPVYCSVNDIDYQIGQKVVLKGSDFGADRESRIQRTEQKLYNKYICIYQIGDNATYSRLNNIERDARSANYAISSPISGGGSKIAVITKYDTTKPQDYNVYSALRSDEEFLSKKKDDSVGGQITYLKGLISEALAEFKGGISVDGDSALQNVTANKISASLVEITTKLAAKLAEVENIDVSDTLSAFIADVVTLYAQEAEVNNLKTITAEVSESLKVKNQTVSGQISSLNYAEALLGWFIKQDGTAQLKGLKLLEFLDVPELRYNRVTVLAGESWRGPGAGLIESVDTDNMIVSLKLEEGDYMSVKVGDICKGIFHYDGGFQTVFFTVTELIDDKSFAYRLRPGYTKHPQSQMSFISYGSFTDPARRSSAQETPKYQRYLKNVDNWEITPSMIALQFGDLSDLSINGNNMSGYSAYLNNIYMSGTIKELDEQPLRIALDFSLGNYLGLGETGLLTTKLYRGWLDETSKVLSWTISRESSDLEEIGRAHV